LQKSHADPERSKLQKCTLIAIFQISPKALGGCGNIDSLDLNHKWTVSVRRISSKGFKGNASLMRQLSDMKLHVACACNAGEGRKKDYIATKLVQSFRYKEKITQRAIDVSISRMYARVCILDR